MEGLLILAVIGLALMYYGKNDDYENLERRFNELNANRIHLSNAQSIADRTRADSYKSKTEKEANIYYQGKVNEANSYYNKRLSEADFVRQCLEQKISEFPVLAVMISDWQTAKDDALAQKLRIKKRPAPKASDVVKGIKEEKRLLIAENKAYKWELQYLRNLLPWIEELEDDIMQAKDPVSAYYNDAVDDSGNIDEARHWLSPEEYNKLSDIEKYQKALDRYKRRNKSNAEIGREYERYIGYLYEQKGYTVEYYGIKKGVEDLGRDLICTNGNEIHVVQCKCWSNIKKKTIHEKHINQLFGTAMVYYLEYPKIEAMKQLQYSQEEADSMQYREDDDIDLVTWNMLLETIQSEISFISPSNLFQKVITPVFFSTVPYTKMAKEFGNALGVIMKEEPMEEYPLIKCNINKNKQKIYHLPFDQQYDNCLIKNKGECYVKTVAEAEAKGFRRAKRWSGN